MALSTIRASR